MKQNKDKTRHDHVFAPMNAIRGANVDPVLVHGAQKGGQRSNFGPITAPRALRVGSHRRPETPQGRFFYYSKWPNHRSISSNTANPDILRSAERKRTLNAGPKGRQIVALSLHCHPSHHHRCPIFIHVSALAPAALQPFSSYSHLLAMPRITRRRCPYWRYRSQYHSSTAS